MMTTVPIVLTILLIVLLIKREFLSGMDSARSRAILRGLNIAIIPLLVVFLVMVGIQLKNGKSNDIAETARANMLETSVSTTQTVATSAAGVASVATTAPTAGSVASIATAAPTRTSVAPTIAPSSASVATAPPTAAPTAALVPDVVSQQVSASEMALRSGQIDAVIAYRGGTRSSAELRFDLSTADGGPRLYMTTLYTGTNSTQRYEQVVIGDKTWKRTTGSAWTEEATQIGVREQVQGYLPQADRIQNSEATRNGQAIELRWSNAAQSVTNTLSVESSNGIPQALQRMMGANNADLAITYSKWNQPVEIQAPNIGKKRK